MRRLQIAMAAATVGAVSCTRAMDPADHAAKERVWSREDTPDPASILAKDALLVSALHTDADARARILKMTFAEIAARLGDLEYRGTSRVDVTGPGRRFSILTQSSIRQARDGSFHIIESDRDGSELRQGLFSEGIFMFSSGGGAMRMEDLDMTRGHAMREEVFSPLSVFTGYFGERLGLRPTQKSSVGGRSATSYNFVLEAKADRTAKTSTATKNLKEPKSLSGSLAVDDETGCPVFVHLLGTFLVHNIAPDASADSTMGARASVRAIKTEPSELTIALDFTLSIIDPPVIRSNQFIPSIRRRPPDLDPLAFLKGRTQTSTIIGDPRSPGRTKP